MAAPEGPSLPTPVFAESTNAAVELLATLRAGDSVADLLTRSGAAKADAGAAATLVADSLPAGVPAGTQLTLLLGETSGKSARRLERLSFQPNRTFRVVIGRTPGDELRLVRDAVSVDATPQRFRGKAGTDLFWSLRAAGVPAEAAREYVEALGRRVDTRSLGPSDEFDLVLDHWRNARGEGSAGPLLYAGLRRASGQSVQLVRWTIDGRSGWYDPARPTQRVEGFEQPVAGRLTSSFGYRIHPILRFGRFHQGVDFGAAWGTPVFAAADGVVSGAGWNGGHGRQVRLAHSDGVQTSYSHLSRIVAVPGTRVRRGDLIGLVGSSGFSTGAHLHFEVRRHGAPVDPLSFRQATVTTIPGSDLAALKARLEQLRSI
ncbi:MAG TPA: M23 family metallopeptidase [Sphingomicrobium sp.]|nr:M23 family metallopeptidase [Sphingomicrobium sp.]